MSVTVALACAELLLPVHVRLNVALAFKAPVDAVPDTPLLPDHAPDAVHAVLLVVLHVMVEEPPFVTVVGNADRLTVGAAGAGGGVAIVAAGIFHPCEAVLLQGHSCTLLPCF